MRHIESAMNAFANPLESRTMAMNESFGYELEGKGEISLHIHHNAADKSLGEKLALLKESLHGLARLLKGMDELKDVKTITTTSWIVTEKPQLLKRLGFTIENTTSKQIEKYKDKYKERIAKLTEDIRHLYKPEIEPGYAHISREDFLKLYDDSTEESPGELNAK